MDSDKRINAFSTLGEVLRDSIVEGRGKHVEKLNRIIELQQFRNPWFTPGNVRTALLSLAQELTAENLRNWTGNYPSFSDERESSTIGLIFAGNIPLAGFHDFMSVLISGNRLIAKTSSKDPDLIPLMNSILCEMEPEFSGAATFTTGVLSGFDAIIATGSNNSSRYFEYYFGNYPNIIRKNRNSIAVLDGSESVEDLKNLGDDIFIYFGLGCRNVSKIFIPSGYDPGILSSKWSNWSSCIDHSRYANNYDYNKAIFLVNRHKFHDAGFVLLKEDEKMTSPVAVIHYEFYTSMENVRRKTEELNDDIQCIIGKNHIPFGRSQMPHLWDYADGIDTLEFLLKKNRAGRL